LVGVNSYEDSLPKHTLGALFLSLREEWNFLFERFIYLFEREGEERAHSGGGAEGEGESQADSVLSAKPIRGLIP